MSDLDWFELFPPRRLDESAVTGLVRLLASRSRSTFLKHTPVVVLELRAERQQVRWYVGMEQQLSASLPGQLQAGLPGLGVVRRQALARPHLDWASNVRIIGMAWPLRLDVAPAITAGLLEVLGSLAKNDTAVVQWVVGPSQGRKVAPAPFNLAEILGFQQPAPPEPGERPAWSRKVSEPLFAVRGRVGATTRTLAKTRAVIYGLGGALSLANAPHTELRVSKPRRGHARALDAVYAWAGTWSGIANAAELATLLGWPLAGVESPLLASGHINRVPAALRLPVADQQNNTNRVLGASLHPADGNQLVTMPVATTMHNVVVSGPTGSGKSTELAHFILADVAAGHGVFVMEPRKDLIDDVLVRLPKHRWDDVVIINPADEDQVGFNPLAGPLHEAERRADEVAGLFRALFGSAIGARSADVLFHGLLTAARMEDGTLADVPILLSNPVFRRRALAEVTDPLVLGPWWAEFEGRTEADRQAITAPINNKLRALLSRRSIRRMLGQGKPAFSFDELFLKQPRVVLVNLNRGVIGPESSRVLGSLVLLAAWHAAQRRATLPRSERFPVMWTVDEFQDYVGALDFGEVLSQCRGLGCSITCAHQNTHQLSSELQAGINANARSRLAFRPSQNDVKGLAAAFGPTVTPDDLERLGAFEMCARLLVNSQVTPPFTVKTLRLPPATTSAGQLRRLSMKHYASNGHDLDKALLERWQGSGGTPDGPIGMKRRRSS